jgi:hypothetical protein
MSKGAIHTLMLAEPVKLSSWSHRLPNGYCSIAMWHTVIGYYRIAM